MRKANQAVLQGVRFRGVQVLRSKKAHFAACKKGPENRQNEVKLRPPPCRPLKHSMSKPGPNMGKTLERHGSHLGFVEFSS